LELLANFNAFLEDQRVPLPLDARVEEKFEFLLHPDLKLRGRIDRLDVGPEGQALVIDYKYSAANRIKDRVEDTESGDSVQAGLYLLAAERVFRVKPAGVLFCGLRQEVTWGGWHASIPGLEQIGERATPEALAELRDAAVDAALRVQQEIASGRIAPEPKVLRKCEWCDFRDICRVEVAAAVRKAGS
jgi:ATP-dependent helicase/nuclease subunit B